MHFPESRLCRVITPFTFSQGQQISGKLMGNGIIDEFINRNLIFHYIKLIEI